MESLASKKMIARYSSLCTELGDLVLRMERSAKRVEEIKKELEIINGLHNIFAAETTSPVEDKSE